MLEKLHNIIFKNFKKAIFCLTIFCALCIFLISRTNFNSSIADILPVKDSIISEHEIALEKFGQSNSLYFSIYANQNFDIEQLAISFSEQLKEIPELKDEFHGVDASLFLEDIDKLLAFLPYVLDEESLNLLAEKTTEESLDKRLEYFKTQIAKFGAQGYGDILRKDPYGILDVFKERFEKSNLEKVAQMQGSAMVSADGESALIIASFNFDAKDSKKSIELVKKVNEKISEFKNQFSGTEISYVGAYRISADNAKMAMSDSLFCVIISVILMFLLCAVAFNGRYYVVLVFLPSMLGTLLSFALIGLIFENVSSIAIAFASIAIGISIDYAIHFMIGSSAKKDSSLAAVSQVAKKIARPTLISAGTTIIAFLIMLIVGSRGFIQLGIFGAIGVITAAFASLIILPVIFAKLKPKPLSATIFDFIAGKIYATKRYYIFYAIVIVFTILSIFKVSDISFDGKISSFNGIYKETKSDYEKISKNWSSALSKTLVIVRGDDFDSALQKNSELFKKLSANDSVHNLDSLSLIIPTKESREENLKNFKFLFSDKEDVLRKVAKKHKFKVAIFETHSQIKDFNQAYSDLNESAFSKLFEHKIREDESGFYIATLFNLDSKIDRAKFYESIKGENIFVADNLFFESYVSQLAKDWMFRFFALSLLIVSLYVTIAFKSIKYAFIVMFSVALGMLWTFAIMAFFGINITLVNAIFVIFAVCIAEDYAVFIIFERLRNENSNALQAVMLAAFTTIIAFGVLAFANHPVLNGLGSTAAISIFSVLLSSILFAFPISRKLKGKNGI